MRFRLTIIIFFVSFYMMSQEQTSVQYTNTPLSQVFIDIEKKFNIKLSFNSDVVFDQFINFQLDDATLEEILLAIENQVNISFRKESERYYVIKKLPKSDLTTTQELDEVILTEYLTSGITRENEDTSVLVSPQRLGILPGLTEPDVLQSIQLLPGVQSPTETASGLYIRGGTPDQNLVLWDGIKMYHSGHFFGLISAFNPYITENVKLYKSGTKAQYGNRISGVIDITSERNIPKDFEGGFGSNMTHADAYIKAPIGKSTAVVASARRSINDVFTTETFKNLAKRAFQDTKISEGNRIFEDDEVTNTKDLFYFTDFTLKAIAKPNDKNTLSVSSLFTKNKLDYGFLIEQYDEASRDQLDIENKGTSLNWNYDYSRSFSQEASFYYSEFNLNYIGGNSITNEFSDQLTKDNIINDFGLSYDLDLKINEISDLNFGYQFASSKVEYALRFEDSESPEEDFDQSNAVTNNSHALYFDYRLRRKNKWFINIGLRTNYFSVLDKVFVEPRFQFEANINSEIKFKTSGESLHQAVSQVVEFNTKQFGLENQIWVISDGSDIPVLSSLQLTSGFVFNKNGWDIDLEGYIKNVKGLTSFTLGFENVDDFFSRGKSNVLGVELLIKKKIQNYRTWLSYSFVNNDFKFNNINDGNSFPSNADITHQLTWSHTYVWNGFDISLGWNIRTGIPYTKATGIVDTPNGSVINFEETNGDRLPSYHRLDISTTYKFDISKNDRWKGKLGFSLLNIYNQKSILSRTYEKRQSNTNTGEVLREINKISLGITPNLVFRVEF